MTTTTTVQLPDFLLARIAEDEEAARRAAFGYGAVWASEADDGEDWSVVHADGKRDMVGCEDGDVTQHVARHDPARVLAECDAKRRIVVAAEDYDNHPWGGIGDDDGWTALEWALRVLALPYADHPDYDERWRP